MKKITSFSLIPEIRHGYVPKVVSFIFIGIAVFMLAVPTAELPTLTVICSAGLLVAGLLEVFFSVSNRDTAENWGFTLMLGLFALITGTILISYDNTTLKVFMLSIGAMAAVRSIAMMGYALYLRKYKIKEWFKVFILGGVGLLFAVLLIVELPTAAFVNILLVAITLIFLGVFGLMLSKIINDLKNFPRNISSTYETPKDPEHPIHGQF